MLPIRLRTEGSRAGRLKTRGLRGIGVSPAASYEAMSTELLRRRLHGRRRGVENNPRCSQSNSARARGRVLTPSLPIYRKPPATLRQGSDAPQGAGWRSPDGQLVQNCDWLPSSIEPDCRVRGIIDDEPNRFAKRGDPFREAIENLPHETHRGLCRKLGDLEPVPSSARLSVM